MKSISRFKVCCGLLVLVLSACGEKANVKSELSDLEKSFKKTGATAPADSLAPGQTASAEVWVDRALSAARANDYAGSVIALQTAQSANGASAEQLMKVQRAMMALTSDLAQRADKGDARAKADLVAIEKTRSQ
ncbi:MAG: hypothetical protein ABIQ35_05210 [Verrucomicrobiota bacterium]